MKIAIVSDIHGNFLALEAVLADLKKEAPDLTVNLGDCLSGALWPEETAELLRETDWPTVRGNHDRFLIEHPIDSLGPTDAFAAERISAATRDWLATTQTQIRLEGGILLCHGTPQNDNRFMTERNDMPMGHRPDEATLLADLNGEQAPFVCCGHSHIPRDIRIEGTGQRILNPGSVGSFPSYEIDYPDAANMPADTNHAQYALLLKQGNGWAVQMKSVVYDWSAASVQAGKNGNQVWEQGLKMGFYRPLA